MDRLEQAAFELAYGRRPAAGEEATIAALLAATAAESDLLIRALLALRQARQAPEAELLRQLARQPLAGALQRGDHLQREAYVAACARIHREKQPLVIGQAAYMAQHQARFWELFNACAYLLAGRSTPVILEFGMSEFSALYRELCGPLILHLSDRPVADDYVGFTERTAYRRLGCDAFFAIDLEQPAVLANAVEPAPGSYDLICFAEVLEHLVVNPVELLRALLSRLKPNGFLYLTTPNLFGARQREQWTRMENPQAVFPAPGRNWDCHHHFREYGAPELYRFIAAAGGRTVAFYYSACWDTPAVTAEEERGNLVFVVAPTAAPGGEQQ